MAQLTPNTEWITVRQMQHMLSLGRTKAYELLSQEEGIETVKIGTAIRVNRASLERWLKEQSHPTWREYG